MEGGTENDLRILEQEEEEEQAGKPGEPSKKEEGRAGPGLGDGERKANDKDDKKEDGKQVCGLGLLGAACEHLGRRIEQLPWRGWGDRKVVSWSRERWRQTSGLSCRGGAGL